MGAHAATASVGSSAARSENRFFTDIEGLRGIAVTAVVAYHAGIPFIGGGFVGVDVFFVISGFLITGLLLREHERSGRISLKGFYARRFRRIIPPAALVIVVTSAAIWLLLPLLSIFRQAFDLLAASAEVASISSDACDSWPRQAARIIGAFTSAGFPVASAIKCASSIISVAAVSSPASMWLLARKLSANWRCTSAPASRATCT